MELHESLALLIEKMSWQLDSIATKIAELSSNICNLIDGLSTTDNNAVANNQDLVSYIISLKRVASSILNRNKIDKTNSNVRNACYSFLHYYSRVNNVENNLNLPALFGVAYSSLNLYYSYCSSINPIKINQPVLFFFQACPVDQPPFSCIDECNGIVDYCSKTGTYPVIIYATNPSVFQKTLVYYSQNPYHILHFSSHGDIGRLVFCTSGTYKSISIQPAFVIKSLSLAMKKYNKLPLIYANACFSDSFVRHFMVRKANAPVIRRVLGISGSNNDYYANKFSLSFYNYLSVVNPLHLNLDSLPLIISNSLHQTKVTFIDERYNRKVILMKRRKNK